MILKRGSSGPEVVKLQKKLIERGWLVGQADGMFGPLTDSAVRRFQAANNLVVDGKVGPLTEAALFDGVIIITPPPADGVPEIPHSYADVRRIFGTNVEGGSSVWEAANLAFCEVPATLKCFGLKNGKRGFTCHRLLVPSFQAVFNEIVATGYGSKIYSYDGCYNPRKIAGSSNLSLHAFAIAIDLNYEGNELGEHNPTMDLNVVRIFKKYNFIWGAEFSRTDPMHFEYHAPY